MAKTPLASILVVEDDGELAEVLQLVLEDAGYKVAGVMNGEDALKQMASAPVDLVVLDVNMEGMSGIDVARQLRSRKEASDVLIALHTGLDEASVREQFADYDLFMPKVDDADALVKMIAALLAKRTPDPNREEGGPMGLAVDE